MYARRKLQSYKAKVGLILRGFAEAPLLAAKQRASKQFSFRKRTWTEFVNRDVYRVAAGIDSIVATSLQVEPDRKKSTTNLGSIIADAPKAPLSTCFSFFFCTINADSARSYPRSGPPPSRRYTGRIIRSHTRAGEERREKGTTRSQAGRVGARRSVVFPRLSPSPIRSHSPPHWLLYFGKRLPIYRVVWVPHQHGLRSAKLVVSLLF